MVPVTDWNANLININLWGWYYIGALPTVSIPGVSTWVTYVTIFKFTLLKKNHNPTIYYDTGMPKTEYGVFCCDTYDFTDTYRDAKE